MVARRRLGGDAAAAVVRARGRVLFTRVAERSLGRGSRATDRAGSAPRPHLARAAAAGLHGSAASLFLPSPGGGMWREATEGGCRRRTPAFVFDIPHPP